MPAQLRIAAPVRNPLTDVVAALSIIVPDDEHAHAGIPALLAAARGVTRTLSGRGSTVALS